ncbi:DUF2750 domain-containing protein [Winogradskyella sp. UBA3174]|uniref:DUF2750 domain-containing protein n=1 Tax=Winogradskyella sp. UBA3174 TaxID=1947785 RepID=UPI0025FD1E43|nr:DUF2750 domain-containing protein [Winogradskyella sp. UBA3174]|tara:strand:+ start:1751 stop:2125 length:375 start_codon:yes stop_codon:yes gene_type:complete
MNSKKIENILSLNNKERYDYLIRKVSDFEQIYLILGSLNQMTDINGQECFPVFPEKEFAEIIISHIPNGKKIKKYDLNEFIQWISKFNSNEYKFLVFPDENINALIKSPLEFKNDLIEECKQYE